MKECHLALIVEDDKETAEDLQEILRSIDCESHVVDNKEDALKELENRTFCLILLDLEIKRDPDSIKGHIEHGRSLLRNIRERHNDHNGSSFWLPVLVVSGFAREASEAVDIMKDNASDVVHKPLNSQVVSERIRRALRASGRQGHEHCHEPPMSQRVNPNDDLLITIPGDRVRRRTTVKLGSHPVALTDSSLKVLMRLMLAQLNHKRVHKRDLGATGEQGFKGISILRNELKEALGTIDIIKNHYHGEYSFLPNVNVGSCATEKLLEIGDNDISALAQQLQDRLKLHMETV